jgi:hypothetical protein
MSFKPGDIVYDDPTHDPQPPYKNTGYCTRFIVDEVKGTHMNVCGYIGPKVDGVQDCSSSVTSGCYKYGMDPTREANVPLFCMVKSVLDMTPYDKCNLCDTAPGPMSMSK